MKITFKDEHIVPELKSATGFEIIGELIDHLARVGTIPIDAAAPVTAAVRQRENSMSTGIGFGLAIPHAATPLINELILAFGRSPGGIEFNSLDGQPVRLVMLVLIPAREREKHLLTLAHISRLLHGKEIRAALERAPDGEAITQILNGGSLIPA
jgi:mannitol/fructose-specific phosphotransferase system IIA component (Ntr-type)